MTKQAEKKLQTFVHLFPIQQFSKGDFILRASEQSDFFYFVETGAVKMTTTSNQGQNLVLHIFNPGSCFSLLTLISAGINKYDFTSLLPTTIYKVPQGKFISFLQENVDVMYEFNLNLLRGLQGLLNRIEQTTFVPAQKQVAGLLLYLARHFTTTSVKSGKKKIISLKVTHQEIAEWLGLTRENVSIQMKQLENKGFIRKQESHIEIVDIKKLEQLADLYSP